MRIVFFGSDDFAAVHLKQLIQSRHTVVGCVTQPDAQKGRGMKLVLSPIKVLAESSHIPYLQPETLKDGACIPQLKEFNADIFVVVAYGRLLTQAVLDIPKKFCVNVHGSLLPEYRGAAPINWAILNGDRQTGVTVQKMVLALDAGDIIAQEKIDIPLDMTADVLRAQMAEMAARLLISTLDNIEAGTFEYRAQDADVVTYAPKLTKEMGLIDWHDDAQVIFNQIRGLKPWPGTYTTYQGRTLKVLSAQVVSGEGSPGAVISVDKAGFTVACGHDALLIKDVLPEAGKPMSARSFVDGYKINVDSFFG